MMRDFRLRCRGKLALWMVGTGMKIHPGAFILLPPRSITTMAAMQLVLDLMPYGTRLDIEPGILKISKEKAMKPQYASMPEWLFNALGITRQMDILAFRQHDHDYGGKGLRVTMPNGNLMQAAKTREEADEALEARLISMGLARWKAWIVWAGCRLLKGDKWRAR